MKHRLLTCFALLPLTLAVLAAGPAGVVAGTHAATTDRRATTLHLAATPRPTPVEMAAVGEPAEPAADPVGSLAGALVVGAAVAFAGTATVRRRTGARR